MEITISLPKKVENALLKKAENSGTDIRAVVEKIIEVSVEPDLLPVNDAEFSKDMLGFAEGTEGMPVYTGDHSRNELYADHD